MKRATRNAAKTKQAIIEKSAPVFNVHGYSGTKMQMLIDATGYQMGGIYRHFDTKMDLAKAVFQFSYETLIKPNLQVEEQLSPKEKLLTIVENYKKMIMNPAIPGGCPILNTATEVDDTHAELRQLTQSYVAEILSIIEEILAAGKAAGTFQPTVAPQKEVLFLFASFEGAILIGKITQNAKSIFDIFEKIVSYLRDSVFQD